MSLPVASGVLVPAAWQVKRNRISGRRVETIMNGQRLDDVMEGVWNNALLSIVAAAFLRRSPAYYIAQFVDFLWQYPDSHQTIAAICGLNAHHPWVLHELLDLFPKGQHQTHYEVVLGGSLLVGA